MALRLSAFYFAFFAYVGLSVAYLPLYLAHRGLDPVAIAAVLALPPLARIFVPAAWGWIADRTGAHRAIVAFSCAVTAAGFAALPFTAEIAIVIGLMSLFAGGALPLVEAITMGTLAGQPGKYGPIRLWGSISFLIVVLAGGAWLDYRPVSALPSAVVVCMLAGFAVALTLPSAKRHPVVEKAPLRISREIVHLLAAGFCNAAAHGALYAFLTLHLTALGYSGTMIGVLWTLGVVAEIGVFLWLPQLFRRLSLSSILVTSLALGAVRFLAVGWLADVLWIVLLAQVLHAATFGAFHAASVAAVHRLFPEHAQARGQTLFSSLSNGAGAAAGVLLAGWAWEGGGAGMAFSACAAASAAGVFFAARLKRANL
jgi:MFS transporter, PPP family, 3-phenylpropionic acid transporter